MLAAVQRLQLLRAQALQPVHLIHLSVQAFPHAGSRQLVQLRVSPAVLAGLPLLDPAAGSMLRRTLLQLWPDPLQLLGHGCLPFPSAAMRQLTCAEGVVLQSWSTGLALPSTSLSQTTLRASTALSRCVALQSHRSKLLCVCSGLD